MANLVLLRSNLVNSMEPSKTPPATPPTTPEEPGSLEANAPETKAPSPSADAAAPSPTDPATSDVIEARSDTAAPLPVEVKKKSVSGILQRINIYLLIFGLVVIIGIAVTVIAFIKTPSTPSSSTIKPQNLSASQLQLLASGSTTIGASDQVLNIEPNTIFSGQVLIRKDLDVAGNINVSQSVNLGSVTVTGIANLEQVQAGKLAVSGNAAIAGQVAINNTLAVSGASSFGGTVTANQLTVQSLELNGDLTISEHILVTGAAPTASPGGGALGTGGTVSISGTDTAGSVIINTGSSPGTGCFMTITFTHSFSSSPSIIITPVGSAAGGLAYYITRTASNFDICTNSAAPASTSFGFDYIVI
jgi:cytoskeletal protein CcmA (bactofilin family)